MSIFINIYNIVFFEPLYNALVFLSGVVPYHDIGIAIVLLTLIVKFILFPFSHKSVLTQAKMRRLEPEIAKIKEKHKKDNQEQSRKIMELYRIHGINPFSGCILLLIQLPIIFALYKVFLSGLDFNVDNLYYFISSPETVRTLFLGIINLSERSYFLAILAGASQFFQMKLAIPPAAKQEKDKKTTSFKDELSRSMRLQMRYVMPGIIFFIALRFSSAIALYWTTMNLFAIVHEILVKKSAKKLILNNDNEETENNNQRDNRENT